jgi:hypothetical protein
MDSLESITRRIRKLLAIAEDTRANPNEAAAAASQAEKLMRKFQLDHADVMRRELELKDAFGTVDSPAVMKRNAGHKPRKVPGWAGWIAHGCAQLNDCEVAVARTPELGACVRFFGFKADVMVAAWTFDYVMNALIAAVREFQVVPRSKSESDSYRKGYAISVSTALRRALEAKRAEAAAHHATNALVVLKGDKLRERFGNFKYTSAKKIVTREAHAYMAGRIDGSRLDVTRRGVGADTPEAQQLIA